MHPSSMNNMKKALDIINISKKSNLRILDVGGRGLKKDRSYKGLLENYALEYHIADIQEGLGVTHLMEEMYEIPASDDYYDLIVSGQTLEHVYNPFRLINEMKRVLKPKGNLIIIVPSSGPKHDTVDCWRFLDDAFTGISKELNLKTIADWIDRQAPDDRSRKWADHIYIGEK